jgi:hypothetical protein
VNSKVCALYFTDCHETCVGRKIVLRDTSEQSAFSRTGENSWRYNESYGRSTSSFLRCTQRFAAPLAVVDTSRCAVPPSSQLLPERVSTRGDITLVAHINSQSDSSSHRKSWPLKTDLIHPQAAVFQAGALAGPRSRRLSFWSYLLFATSP